MNDLRATFHDRVKEIDGFLDLMQRIETKEFERGDGNTLFEYFFGPTEADFEMSYQSFINIMKSNVSLMIYNIIEFTVSNLVDEIYHTISWNRLGYTAVSDDIQKIWRSAILRAMNDPNANFNTFIKKNKEIIDFILEDKVITLQAKNSLAGGNLDGQVILESFKDHGITINMASLYNCLDVLSSIKEQRNKLAHGSVSFVEALRDETISEIVEKKNLVVIFLKEIIENVAEYIINQQYKQQVANPR